jgi:hypothetical protein
MIRRLINLFLNFKNFFRFSFRSKNVISSPAMNAIKYFRGVIYNMAHKLVRLNLGISPILVSFALVCLLV